MTKSDAVLGWVTTGGQFFHLDTYMSGYTAPSLDRSQVNFREAYANKIIADG
jgi:hypothetical protein